MMISDGSLKDWPSNIKFNLNKKKAI